MRPALLVGLVLLVSVACGGSPPSAPAPSPKAAPTAAQKEPPVPEGSIEEALQRVRDVSPLLERPETVAYSDGGNCSDIYKLKPIEVTHASASSSLTENKRVHRPELVLDNDPATAWVEGVAGDGVGERLWFQFKEGLPDVVGIVPGYAADARRWEDNQRVSEVLIRFLKPKVGDPEEPAGGWRREDLVYTGTEGIRSRLATKEGGIPFGQAFYIDFAGLWVQNMEDGEVVALELRILGVEDQGAKYDDTCISEVIFLEQGEHAGLNCPPGMR